MSISSKQMHQDEERILSDEAIKTKAREVLYKNMVSGQKAGFNYHYTKPSPNSYPYQYFWDTCMHIFTLTAIGEVEMAKKHVHSLFEMQGADGFVGHMHYWKRVWPARITDVFQLMPTDVLQIYKPHMSALIQPPLAAQAVLRIYQLSQDVAFVKNVLPKLKKFYRWLAENRDFEQEGLLSIISPFESGMDWKPSYDPVLKYNKGKAGPKLFWKVLQVDVHNFLKGYNLQKIYKSNKFIIKDVAFNTIYAQNLEALASLCHLVEDQDEQYFKVQAKKTESSIFRYMYDEQDKAFYDLYGHNFSKLKIQTGTIFFPVVLKSVSEEICREILEKHLLHKNGFHVPYPIPSLATHEKAFNPEESLYIWRGPTWVVFNWFMHEYLLTKGYEQEAHELLLTVKRLITKSGFRENYNPFTGQGLGAEDFTWSGLVVDMITMEQNQQKN